MDRPLRAHSTRQRAGNCRFIYNMKRTLFLFLYNVLRFGILGFGLNSPVKPIEGLTLTPWMARLLCSGHCERTWSSHRPPTAASCIPRNDLRGSCFERRAAIRHCTCHVSMHRSICTRLLLQATANALDPAICRQRALYLWRVHPRFVTRNDIRGAFLQWSATLVNCTCHLSLH